MASNRYRHPHAGAIGALGAWLANSPSIAHMRQALMSRLPFMQLESDVTDVVYMTWMIDVEAAQRLVPSGYALWQRDGKTPFTILTYRHGNFGPAFLGPLRRMMPSPMQSNWRLYGAQPNQVFFVKNVMSSFLHALGTRMFSDVLQTHYPESFHHAPQGEWFKTEIVPGAGSAPALATAVRASAQKSAPPQFDRWDEAVRFLACQDAAVAYVERSGQLAISEISLPIDVRTIIPLETDGDVTCSLLPIFEAVAQPFCFLVPKVPFRVLSERIYATKP